MSFEDACTFVSLIKKKTGRWPMIYGSNLVRDADNTGDAASPAANCPLWYANYNSTPQKVSKKVWKKFALWQFTDGKLGPDPHVIGKERLDRNCFMGTKDDLVKAWPTFM
jgi:GH25 family lysozyme M1 (1,4-beta-N-acetylmuramidase)